MQALFDYISGLSPFWLLILILVTIASLVGGVIALMRYHANWTRCLDMVFLQVKIPKRESKEDREIEGEKYSSTKDFKEVTGVMTHFFESLFSTYNKEYTRFFRGQDFFSFEYALIGGLIHFYIVVPKSLAELLEKQVTAFYSDAVVEQVDDYNIFQPGYSVVGLYERMERHYMFPIKTYQRLGSDPLNNFINAFTKMDPKDGAAIQMIIRPKRNGWQNKGRQEALSLIHI